MGLIGINEIVFPATISRMQIAGNAINGNITSWVSKGEKSTAFTRFSDDYNILQDVIKEYKYLVLKDVATINKVGVEIIKIDDTLLNFWR